MSSCGDRGDSTQTTWYDRTAPSASTTEWMRVAFAHLAAPPGASSETATPAGVSTLTNSAEVLASRTRGAAGSRTRLLKLHGTRRGARSGMASPVRVRATSPRTPERPSRPSSKSYSDPAWPRFGQTELRSSSAWDSKS
eukprot:2821993-Prymnesium_polylepis.1